MNEFTAVGSATEVPVGAMKAYEIDGVKIAVANVGGSLHAFGNVCTHQRCPLAKGNLTGSTVTCPCHGSQFDVTTGAVLKGPASAPVGSFPARVHGDQIEVAI
ncbi:MAG TPA: non-heme iron oxygenase ferredoxin subunit [Actinomycetota bacterium]|nr:non-heme iron oxygenase ferredoxin subunit [Actinomycetota bacterium]